MIASSTGDYKINTTQMALKSYPVQKMTRWTKSDSKRGNMVVPASRQYAQSTGIALANARVQVDRRMYATTQIRRVDSSSS